jgi:hypothetical protein
LPKDKFLRAQAEAHPDGLVDLSLLLSFSRMRGLLGVSQRRPLVVAAAVVFFSPPFFGASRARPLLSVPPRPLTPRPRSIVRPHYCGFMGCTGSSTPLSKKNKRKE